MMFLIPGYAVQPAARFSESLDHDYDGDYDGDAWQMLMMIWLMVVVCR